MSHGPLIFLGVLATFVASWWGLVFAPQLQIGSQPSAQTDSGIYPTRPAGVAQQGREVYVANGCVQCHGQQARQESFTFDVVLTSAGTNATKVAALLQQIAPGINANEVFAKASDKSPQRILTNVVQSVAEDAQKQLKSAGAGAQFVFIPLGADIGRRWASRRSVGADYLFDYPVQVGNSRLGPDLSNYGNRAPAPELILAHLYDPRVTLPGSIMPAHHYMFETRPAGKQPSVNALKLTGKFAPEAGYEAVPKAEALQLVAYLQGLRADTALFEAPMTQLAPPPASAGTNASGATNASAAVPNTPKNP
jgi:cbb3-type cytochrome oxidase cytochrome c subunit